MPAMVEGGAPGAARGSQRPKPSRPKPPGTRPTSAPAPTTDTPPPSTPPPLPSTPMPNPPYEPGLNWGLRASETETAGTTATATPEAPAALDPGAPGSRKDYNPDLVTELQQQLADLNNRLGTFESDGPDDPRHRPVPGQASYIAAIAEARDSVEDQLLEALRAERSHALGMDRKSAVKPPNIGRATDELTTRQYNKLSWDEQAAVRFNTQLAEAVQKDLSAQGKFTLEPAAQVQYDEHVLGMFGEDGGSKYVAPNTVELLRSIGYSDQSSDLDDFLSMKAGISYRDMRKLGPDKDGLPDVQLRKQQDAPGSSTRQASLEALNEAIIEDVQADRMSELMSPDVFPAMIEALSHPDLDVGAYWNAIRKVISPSEMRLFKSFALEKAEAAEKLNTAMWTGEGVEYKSPEEFRQVLNQFVGGDDRGER